MQYFVFLPMKMRFWNNFEPIIAHFQDFFLINQDFIYKNGFNNNNRDQQYSIIYISFYIKLNKTRLSIIGSDCMTLTLMHRLLAECSDCSLT